MEVLILDSTGEIGKHAYSQLKTLDLDVELRETRFIDIPGEMSRATPNAFLVIGDTANRYADTVLEKVLSVEINKGLVEKVFLDSSGKSKEVFNQEAKRKAEERSEKLAEKMGKTERD